MATTQPEIKDTITDFDKDFSTISLEQVILYIFIPIVRIYLSLMMYKVLKKKLAFPSNEYVHNRVKSTDRSLRKIRYQCTIGVCINDQHA